jgi:hypothetical protein
MAAVLLALILSACGSGSSSGSSPKGIPGATFWVSPQGSDDAAGTESAPFLTLERARDAVRALDASASDKDVVVNLREGTYRLERPLELGPQDSGKNDHDVVYRSAVGEHAVISGAMKVEGWQLSDPSLGIYSAFVGEEQSRQLYVNGRRATRAQTEPYPAGFLPAFVWLGGVPIRLGIEFIPTDLNPAGWRDPSTWTNPTEVEAVIVTQWKQMNVRVDTITSFPNYTINPLLQPLRPAATGLITMQEPGWTNSNVFLQKETRQPGIWSFWQVTRFENAYEFLDQPGEFYLNTGTGYLYYIPRPGEDLTTADVELPLLETLVDGQGTLGQPISHVRFEDLTFTGATWLGPNSPDGYVADQSAFRLVGPDHVPVLWGHDQNTVRTHGNLSFAFAHDITFRGNIFEHLGGVGLDFDTGGQGNTIEQNLFTDISSSAIVFSGTSLDDSHPSSPEQVTRDNTMTGNLIHDVAREYQDAAGIFVVFGARTLIENNTIYNVPWSGIAMGWGWGLLDAGMFPGNPGSVRGEWGTFTTLTPNSSNKILRNRFYAWGNILWDTGAIYTQGQQGTSAEDPLLIEGNVATNKRPSAGSNVFYTDGGSRFIDLKNNVSSDNPVGVVYLGPPFRPGDPLPYFPFFLANCFPYGGEIGGCVTYGDINYIGNYWKSSDFYTPCPYMEDGVTYPTNLSFSNNHIITGIGDVPASLLDAAGVQTRPDSIPADQWILPPGEPPEETDTGCPPTTRP